MKEEIVKVQELTNLDRMVNYDKQLRRLRRKEIRQAGLTKKRFNSEPAKLATPYYSGRVGVRAVVPILGGL